MWMLSLALPTQISQESPGSTRVLDFLDHRAAIFIRLLSIAVIARRARERWFVSLWGHIWGRKSMRTALLTRCLFFWELIQILPPSHGEGNRPIY